MGLELLIGTCFLMIALSFWWPKAGPWGMGMCLALFLLLLWGGEQNGLYQICQYSFGITEPSELTKISHRAERQRLKERLPKVWRLWEEQREFRSVLVALNSPVAKLDQLPQGRNRALWFTSKVWLWWGANPFDLALGLFLLCASGAFLWQYYSSSRVQPWLWLLLATALGCIYSRSSLLLIIFWTLLALPLVFLLLQGERENRLDALRAFLYHQGLSSLCFALGLILFQMGQYNQPLETFQWVPENGLSQVGAVFLCLGVALRMGFFPFHTWIFPTLRHLPSGGAGIWLLFQGTSCWIGLVYLSHWLKPWRSAPLGDLLWLWMLGSSLYLLLIGSVHRHLRSQVGYGGAALFIFCLATSPITPQGSLYLFWSALIGLFLLLFGGEVLSLQKSDQLEEKEPVSLPRSLGLSLLVGLFFLCFGPLTPGWKGAVLVLYQSVSSGHVLWAFGLFCLLVYWLRLGQLLFLRVQIQKQADHMEGWIWLGILVLAAFYWWHGLQFWEQALGLWAL